MSSSTITEYQVRENRLRDELAVKAALREASVLEHRLHGLHSQVKQARQLYPEVSENLAVVDIRRAQAGLSTRAAAEAYRKERARGDGDLSCNVPRRISSLSQAFWRRFQGANRCRSVATD